MDAIARASRVKLMAFDVDGVMTDGRLYFSPSGDYCKAFFSRDGFGIKLLARAGIQLAIITGRDSPIVAHRAANLGIARVLQGVEDKRSAMASLLAAEGLDFCEAGFMGDDLIDLPVLSACTFSATVPDGHELVRRAASYVTRAPAGLGAVREVCELILHAQGKWEQAIAPYLAQP
ncbi:MAG: phenylphosphate carboxylase subunit delta [Rhodocyclaceae bacterium]|nr:phenylphosphate carboxylase subunit delta [Rhodocyclaceae bacterium]